MTSDQELRDLLRSLINVAGKLLDRMNSAPDSPKLDPRLESSLHDNDDGN